MLKKLTTVTALLLAAISMTAKQVTENQARDAASAFLQQQGKSMISSVILKAKGIKNTASKEAAYYVFNTADNNGFVVVSGDDRTETILGYTTSGSYDEQTLTPNMKAWLDDYAWQISMLDKNDVAASSSAINRVKKHDAISPLLKTNWGQTAPYNSLCPTISGDKSATGCVATAMAQVMAFHQWPQDYTTTVPGYTFKTSVAGISTENKLEALPPVKFNWEKMPLPTGDKDSAVANLMRYCGQSVQMVYSPDGSNAGYTVAGNAFINYFGYDQNAMCTSRNAYTINEWDSIIYNELENHRPVMYLGRSAGGAHAFVCDGYDGDGLFHINWGWNGMLDGYFRLSILNPYNNSGVGASSTLGGYNMDCIAYVGVQKPTGEKRIPHFLTCKNLTYEDHHLIASLQSTDYVLSPLSYTLGWGSLNSDGTINVIKIGDTKKCANIDFLVSSTKDTLDLSSLTLNPGTYDIFPICHDSTTTEWHRTTASNIYAHTVVDESGKMITDIYPVLGLKTDSIRPKTKRYVGMTQRLEGYIHSSSEFYGELYLFAAPKDELPSKLDYTEFSIEENHNDTAEFFFTPKQTGIYKLYIATDEKGTNIIGTDSINIILPPVSDLKGKIEYSQEEGSLGIIITNNSDIDYLGYIRCEVSVRNQATGNYKKIMSNNIDTKIKVQKTDTLKTSIFCADDIDKIKITVSCYKYSNYSAGGFMTFHEEEVDYISANIDHILSTENTKDTTTYSINGMSTVNTSRRGIYIKDGKKIITGK